MLKRRHLFAIAALGLVAGPVSPPARAAEPTADRPGFFNPIFSTKAFELARVEAAERDEFVVLVIASYRSKASRSMDEGCWSNPAISRWLRDHGTAIRIDIADDVTLAKGLGVTRVPTTIVFDERGEVARVSGNRSAVWMRKWLTEIENNVPFPGSRPGRNTIEASPQLVHLHKVRDLAETGRADEGADVLVKMYHDFATDDPHSFPICAKEWTDFVHGLVNGDPSQRRKFNKLLKEIEDILEENENPTRRLHWIALSHALGNEAEILAWVDTILPQPDAAQQLRHYHRILGGPLIRADRHADWGRIEIDPVGMVIDARRVEDEMRGREGSGPPIFVQRVTAVHIAMLAAGRAEDAMRVARTAAALDESGGIRRTLVRAALDAGHAHPLHRDLLEGDERGLALLGPRLEQRLTVVVPE